MHRSLGDGASEGIHLGNYARLLVETGRRTEAREAFGRALELLRAARNARHEGLTMCGLAGLEIEEGRIEDSREAWRRGAQILRDAGDTELLELLRKEMREACAKAGVEPFEGGGD